MAQCSGARKLVPSAPGTAVSCPWLVSGITLGQQRVSITSKEAPGDSLWNWSRFLEAWEEGLERTSRGGDILKPFQMASLWPPRQRKGFLMLPHDKWQKKGKYHFKQRLIIFTASANFLSPQMNPCRGLPADVQSRVGQGASWARQRWTPRSGKG